MNEKKRLIIIDSNSIIHRAFHALPALTTKKGELVNAIYGFLLVFLRVIKEFQPDYIAACFDFPAPTFRHKKFKEYKAKRPPAPKDLYQQIPKVKEFLETFNVPIFEKEGFEADDIIATLSKLASKKQIFPKIETIIISGDLDTLQLVDSYTKVYLLRRGVKDVILYDQKGVEEKYQGLTPAQLIDLTALKGDPSDNIPGVAGIGQKTAVKLIKELGSLENLYLALSQSDKRLIINQRLLTKLEESKEQTFLSKMLATAKKDVPIEFNLEKCFWKEYDKKKVIKLLKDFDFQSLVKRLEELEKKTDDEKSETIKENLKLW